MRSVHSPRPDLRSENPSLLFGGPAADPLIDIAYFNYEHGGMDLTGKSKYLGGIGAYSLKGLVDVAGQDDNWPHILVVGEGDRYDQDGGRIGYAAARAMREAGGRAYVPLFGSLPRNEGMFAPVIFYDAQSVVVKQWYDHRASDFSERGRNLLVACLPGGEKEFYIKAIHGNIYNGGIGWHDATRLRWLANPATPSAIIGDWNSVPSGPMWEPKDLNSYPYTQPWRRAARILWEHGAKQGGPYRPDTRALDYLLGYWQPSRPPLRRLLDAVVQLAFSADDRNEIVDWGYRVGGIGFYSVAELFHNATPTQIRPDDGRLHTQPLAYDNILVNEPWKDNVEGFIVHPPLEPHPSDHLRVTASIRMSRA